jgi:hypothetical protein
MLYAKYSEKCLKNGVFEDFHLKKNYTEYTRTGTAGILTLDSYPYPQVPVLVTPTGFAYPCHALALSRRKKEKTHTAHTCLLGGGITTSLAISPILPVIHRGR